MKIMVFAHRLEVGGTQLNAILLAAALRDLYGHEVVFFATPGPMVKLVEEKGLRFLPAPDARFHPSVARMTALRNAVKHERPDLIQVWDWWQCLDAYYAVHVLMRVPMVVTDQMMNLTRLLPKGLPTTFGTPELLDRARETGRRRLELVVPPVDIHSNAPGAVDPGPFREQYGIADSDLTLVTVSRLAESLKGESLLRTIEVVRTLGRNLPVRFILVGEGTLRSKLDELAEDVNRDLGRRAVILTGALLDPRPAYAAADIVVGMGGSALRGMAFAKPVVIVGERGFSAQFTPETADSFNYKGIYGLGDGSTSTARLAADIRGFAEHREQFPALGQFSREFVIQRFSVESVASRLERFCRQAVSERPRLDMAVIDGLRTAAVYLRERRFLTPSRSTLST
jgi:L-malate glycosyltransferase